MNALLALALLAQLGSFRNANGNRAILPVVNSAGCGATAPFTGGPTSRSSGSASPVLPLDSIGRTRSATYTIPGTYSNVVPRPLVIGFHEFNGSSAGVDAWGIQALMVAAGAIHVSPQGLSNNFGVIWDASIGTKGAAAYFATCPTCVPPQNGSDVAWIALTITYMKTNFCIDTNRIFIYGFSMGGDMVTSLVCQNTNGIRAAAVAAAGGDFVPDATTNPLTLLNFTAGQCGTWSTSTSMMHHYDSTCHDEAGGGNVFPDLCTARDLYKLFTGVSAISSSAGDCVEWAGGKARHIDCPRVGLGHNRPATWPAEVSSYFLSQ